jgi:hypothetical protein
VTRVYSQKYWQIYVRRDILLRSLLLCLQFYTDNDIVKRESSIRICKGVVIIYGGLVIGRGGGGKRSFTLINRGVKKVLTQRKGGIKKVFYLKYHA